MIESHKVLRLKTLDNDVVEAEINYSNNEKVKESRAVKLKKKGVEFQLSRDELIKLVVAIGEAPDIAKVMPMTLTNVKKVERLLTFEWKASRDYRAGETITIKAPWIDEVVTEEEVLSGNINKRIPKRIDTIHKDKFILHK